MISLLLLALTCTLVGCHSPRDASIPAVQGRAHLSPLLGQDVRVTGVVTAAGPGWMYLQGPPDSDPNARKHVVTFNDRLLEERFQPVTSNAALNRSAYYIQAGIRYSF